MAAPIHIKAVDPATLDIFADTPEKAREQILNVFRLAMIRESNGNTKMDPATLRSAWNVFYAGLLQAGHGFARDTEIDSMPYFHALQKIREDMMNRSIYRDL